MEDIRAEIVNRLYNCKFRTAYEYVKELPDNAHLLAPFERAARDYDDCGWGGEKIDETAEALAALLGEHNLFGDD